jgi:hypothetical protein
MKASHVDTNSSRYLVSALLALSLFGVLYPNRVSAAAVNHRVNMTEATGQSTDDWGYRVPNSPGSHRGWQFGS